MRYKPQPAARCGSIRCFKGDTADKATLERFAEWVVSEHGRVDFLVNDAAALAEGIDGGQAPE